MSNALDIGLEEAILTVMALQGLEFRSVDALQRTVAKTHACRTSAFDKALVSLSKSHSLRTEGKVSWPASALHRATLRLVEKQPQLALERMRSTPSWDSSGGENQVRLAVYLNSLEIPGYVKPFDPYWAARYWLPVWDEDFFASRHPELQARILPSLRPGLWAHGVWSQSLEATLLRLAEPIRHEMSLELAFARGDAASPDAAARRKGYDAVKLFVEGKIDESYARFMKIIAKRKTNIPALEPFVSVYARLAALRVHDLDALFDMRLTSSQAMPALDQLFPQLVQFLKGGPQPDVPTGAGLEWCIVWALRECLHPPERSAAAERLRKSGLWAWLEQLEGKPKTPWGQGIVRREPWQTWLESIRQKGTVGDLKPGKPVTFRLTWEVASSSLRAFKQDLRQPNVRGEVALELLIASPPEFLSEQDHRVLNQIERRQWGTTIDVLSVAAAVRALLGHPHVYFDEEPVQLVEGRQRIRLQKANDGLRIELHPRFRAETDFRCRLLSPGLVEVCFPSPWNASLEPLIEAGHVIPAEAQEELQSAIAPWLDKLDVEYGDGIKPLAETVREGELIARLIAVRGGLRLAWTWSMGQGGPALPAFAGPEREVLRWEGKLIQIKRDFGAEWAALQRYREISPELPEEQDVLYGTLDEALDLVRQLQLAAVPLEWPDGKSWKLRGDHVNRQMSVRAESDGEWFYVRGSFVVDETSVVELDRLLELAREYPGRYIRLDEGDYLEIGEELRRRLKVLDDLLEESKKGLRLSPLAVPSMAELDLNLQADADFVRARERFEEANTYLPETPAALQADLRDYQLEGYRWLSQRARAGVGACLADDMGLGKTVQVLALMIELQSQGAHLVICPLSVTAHWRDQIFQFAPGLRPLLYEGKDRASLLRDLHPGDVVICSYRLLLQDQELFEAIGWNVALIDEAQCVKNPHAQTSRAVFALKAAYRMATTGTPVENRVTELWSIFRFLNPGLLGQLASFRRRFEGQNRASQRQLRRLLAPFLLRRTKGQVLSELPPRTEITLPVVLSDGERSLYELERRKAQKAMEEPGGALQSLAFLTRLRQACCHPGLLVDHTDLGSAKFAAFFELLEDLQAGRHRCLVFSQFTSLLALLEVELQARGVSYLTLDGSTPVAERRRRVADFQGGVGDLFLISLKAGGTGLTLTAADYVVHLDPWWNPASEDQASDRAHRIGQTRPVTIYRFVARDTVEEKVVGLHGVKRKLAHEVLDGREQAAPLSAAEIRSLLFEG